MNPSRYRLIRTIASGGMAHVYEAVAQGEQGFERRVAIKRVLPELSHDESMQRMFFDEARIASHLHHGNIVQVIDFGAVDGSPFIAMEYVDGVDAERAASTGRKRGAPMPDALALHVVAEIAHALAHAHACQDAEGEPLSIVHRDVSPHNILLSWDGDVKLSDFGIAMAATRVEKTATGVVKGKLAYMSPEQAKGAGVGPAADVYSLGATLHALATGAPHGSFGPPPAPVGDEAPVAELVELVQQCMALEESERPETAAVAYRAGQLASRLMDRDARGELKDWLAPLKSRVGKVSALDDLMGLMLVATGDSHDFNVSRIGPEDPGRPSALPTLGTPSGVGREEEAPVRSTASIRLPVRTRGLWVTVAAVVVAGLVGGGALLVGGEEPEAPRPAEEPVAGQGAPGEPPGEAIPDGVDHETVEAEPTEASRTELAATGMQGREAPRVRAPSRPVERPRPEATLPPAMELVEEARPSAEAWVRIPRIGAGQERVVIDGRARGFTPTVVRVTAGTRRISISSVASGEPLLDRTVELTAAHTRVSPFVLR